MLCAGKNCLQKHRKPNQQIREAARDAGVQTGTFSCIGTCTGPTAVVVINGKHRVYERLAKNQSQQDLIDLARDAKAKPSSRLKQRRITGKKAKLASRKLSPR